MRTVCQIPRANALGIWLPVSHAPSCIVTTNPSRTGLNPLNMSLTTKVGYKHCLKQREISSWEIRIFQQLDSMQIVIDTDIVYHAILNCPELLYFVSTWFCMSKLVIQVNIHCFVSPVVGDLGCVCGLYHPGYCYCWWFLFGVDWMVIEMQKNISIPHVFNPELINSLLVMFSRISHGGNMYIFSQTNVSYVFGGL